MISSQSNKRAAQTFETLDPTSITAKFPTAYDDKTLTETKEISEPTEHYPYSDVEDAGCATGK